MKFSVFSLLRASAVFCFLAALGAAQQTTVLYDASTYEQKRPTMAQTLGNATNLAAVNAVSQPLDADLTSIAGNTTGGFLTRTASGTYTARTITGTAGQITVTNGDGVSGAPTISLPSTITQATTFSAGTASTSAGTGTVILSGSGGIGVGGSVYVGSAIGFTDTTITRLAAGNLQFTAPAATGANIDIVRDAAGVGLFRVLTAASRRWAFGASSDAESGANAGASWVLRSYDDSNTFLRDAITVTRATGVTNIASTTASTSTTTGALTVSGGVGVAGRTSTLTVSVGGTNGTAADLIASNTATLDFGSISAAASADLTITVTGASTGDSVALGLPSAPTAGIIFQGFVSASNTVTVRATNITGIAVDPASATYRATVTSF